MGIIMGAFLAVTVSAQMALVPGALWHWYGQPSAVLWSDQLFAAPGWSGSAYPVCYRNAFAPGRGPVRFPVGYWDGGWGGLFSLPCSQAKLEVRDGRLLWAVGSLLRILPLAELAYLEDSEFGRELCRTRKDRPEPHLLAHLYSGDAHTLLFPPHRRSDVPEPKVVLAEHPGQPFEWVLAGLQYGYTLGARIDAQIAGPRSVRLFHAYRDTLFVSVEPDYRPEWYLDPKTLEPKEALPPPPDRGLRTGRLPPGFAGPFAAYTAGGRDYLVTAAGGVYLAAPRGADGLRVSAVWADPARRVVGVVHDPANDAVYGWGFVTTSRAPERFFVRLDPKPVAVPYRLTVPLWGDRADAYLESYECARAFRKAAEKK